METKMLASPSRRSFAAGRPHLQCFRLINGILVEVTSARPRNGERNNNNVAGHGRDVATNRGEGQPSWELLAAVVSRFYHDKLLHCARRSLAWQPTQMAVEPEDLVQATLALLLAGRIRWHGLAGLLPSLYVTIYNLSRDARKAKWSWPARPLKEVTFIAAPGSIDAYDAAYRALLARDQDAALTQLPLRMRAAAKAYFVDRSTAKEVALDHGTTEPTVRNQLIKARPRLQAALERYRPGRSIS